MRTLAFMNTSLTGHVTMCVLLKGWRGRMGTGMWKFNILNETKGFPLENPGSMLLTSLEMHC